MHVVLHEHVDIRYRKRIQPEAVEKRVMEEMLQTGSTRAQPREIQEGGTLWAPTPAPATLLPPSPSPPSPLQDCRNYTVCEPCPVRLSSFRDTHSHTHARAPHTL